MNHTVYIITKQGSTALGLKTNNSSPSLWAPLPLEATATESKPPSSLSWSWSWAAGGWDATLPATTLHSSIARLTFMKENSSSMSSGMDQWALSLLPMVDIPSSFGEKPPLIIPQTPHHSCPQTPSPREHTNVKQWNRSSSFPSAMHLSCRLPLLDAFALMASRYSSNRFTIFEPLWIFRTRWMIGDRLPFPFHPPRKMIRTTFLAESPSRSSTTACFVDWCWSKWEDFWNTCPHVGQGKMLPPWKEEEKERRFGCCGSAETTSDLAREPDDLLRVMIGIERGGGDVIECWDDLVEEEG